MLRSLSRARVVSTDRLINHLRFPLYRNAYALMLSTAVTSALGLFYWILAARFYPPEALGVNAAAISMLTFLAGLAQLPFMNLMLRYIPVAGMDTRRLVVWAYLISTLLSAAIGAVVLLSIEYWSPELGFLRRDHWLGLWFLLGVVSWCIFALQDNVLTGLRQALYVPIENIPYAVVKIGLLIVFAATFTNFGILASWILPTLVVLLPINILIFRRLIPQQIRASADQRLPYSFSQMAYYLGGNTVGAVFLLAATRLLPVLVANQAGATATAYFYLPWTIALSLRLITANMNTSFTVEAILDNTRLRANSYRYLAQSAAVLTPAILFMVLFARPLLSISGAAYAEEGTLLLRLLAISMYPNMIIQLYIGIARVRQNVTGIVVVMGCMCLLTLGLSYLLLPLYGITGVGIAILIGDTTTAITLLFTGLWPILCAPLMLKLNQTLRLKS